jgi:hypothetical protein
MMVANALLFVFSSMAIGDGLIGDIIEVSSAAVEAGVD